MHGFILDYQQLVIQEREISDASLKNFREGQGWESLCSPPSKLISGMICEYLIHCLNHNIVGIQGGGGALSLKADCSLLSPSVVSESSVCTPRVCMRSKG